MSRRSAPTRNTTSTRRSPVASFTATLILVGLLLLSSSAATPALPHHYGEDRLSVSSLDSQPRQLGPLVNPAASSSVQTAPASSPVWTQITLQGATPPYNLGESVYDPAAGYTVFLDSQGSTWSYLGGHWSNLTASLSTSPPARYTAVMVFDGQLNGVLLFGGLATGTGAPLDDTWEFSSGQWHDLTFTVGSSPPNSGIQVYDVAPLSAAYDSHTGSVVLLDDAQTWVFNNSQWSRVATPTSPGVRTGAAMADDPAGQDIILFGGLNDSTLSYLNDTWSFNNSIWSLLSPASSPPAVSSAGLAFFPPGGYMLLAGGGNPSAVDTAWEFAAGSWHAIPSVAPSDAIIADLTFDAHDGYAFFIAAGIPPSGAYWVYGPALGVPQVSIEAVPNNGTAPVSVSFHSKASGGQAPYNFSWILREPPISREFGTSENATYTFNSSGVFEITLIVTDTYGQLGGAFTNITVLASPVQSPVGWNAVDFALLAGTVLGAGTLVTAVWWRLRRSHDGS